MKALLIGINAKYIHPTMSIYQLKYNTNYECDIKEFTIKEGIDKIYLSIKNLLLTNNYDLIGFSCYLWNIELICSLSKVIKQNFPNIKILLGGPEVCYEADYFFNILPIDYIIFSEGEESFECLLKYLDNLISIDKVPNLYYLSNEKELRYTYSSLPDLSKINLATLHVEDKVNRIIYVESSRGCPYNCSYCVASLEKRVRFFNKEEVFKILYELMLSKVKTIKFLDRTFNANEKYMLEILDFIEKHNICSVFQFEIVIEKMSDETINRILNLKNSHLRFEIGIQSTNNLTNEAVGRHQNFDKLREKTFKLNHCNHVDLHLDLIAGLPYEDISSFKRSFNEAFLLEGKELQLGFLKFLRGTKMMDYINEHEYIYDKKPSYEIIQNKYLSKEDLSLIHIIEDSLNYYYNNSTKDNRQRLKKSFTYLFNNKLIDNPWNFFFELSNYIPESKQLNDLFISFDNYFKDKDYYNEIHYFIIQDYLENYLVKPTIWWGKNNLISTYQELILNNIPSLNQHILFNYCVLVEDNNEIYVIKYYNYKHDIYIIKKSS